MAHRGGRGICGASGRDAVAVFESSGFGRCGCGKRYVFRAARLCTPPFFARCPARAGGCRAAEPSVFVARRGNAFLNCDSIARWYRWLEYAAFGGALRRRREAFLFELGDPQKVLVLGDGDGRFLQLFVALYPEARVDAVDVSAGMIELARSRVASDRVTFHVADAREFVFEEEYDLAVAHFFFDCFDETELREIIFRFTAKQFLISEFRRTWWSRPLLAGLYLFFRIATELETRRLSDHRTMLERSGYRLDREEDALGGLLASELWRLSAPLKKCQNSLDL